MPMLKTRVSILSLFAVGALCMTSGSASAITAELARKCREMAIKAHPTQPAGTTTGHAAAQREYFNECVAKNGNMDPEPAPANPDSKTTTTVEPVPKK